MLLNDWINTLGTIGKTAKKNASDIITEQTTTNCKLKNYILFASLYP
jgi:hypothetical protein